MNPMAHEKMKQILKSEIPFDDLEKNAGILEFFEDGSLSIGISWEDHEESGEDVYILNLFVYDRSNIIGHDNDGNPQYASEYINIAGAYSRAQITSDEVTDLLVKTWNEHAHPVISVSEAEMQDILFRADSRLKTEARAAFRSLDAQIQLSGSHSSASRSNISRPESKQSSKILSYGASRSLIIPIAVEEASIT